VHLQPENLLLTSDGDDADIKVADFGFAKKVTELLPNETACGTPGYVAPEILRGDPYGVEVDIWSMGVICYVLLAGYPPFYDDDQVRGVGGRCAAFLAAMCLTCAVCMPRPGCSFPPQPTV
jgi:calcium/calmodulin-dependent protein kinase I